MVIWWLASTGDNIEFEVEYKRGGTWIFESWVRVRYKPTQTNLVLGDVKTNSNYYFKLRACIKGTDTCSAFSSEGNLHTPLPFVGHQADHVVKYQFGTTAPLTDPAIIGPYFPRAVVNESVKRGAGAWNNFQRLVDSPNPKLCQDGNCLGLNRDGKVTMINVVDGSAMNTGGASGVPDCGFAVACVKSRESYATNYIDGQGHMRNNEIVIEHPAWAGTRLDRPGHNQQRIFWTLEVRLHNEWVGPEGEAPDGTLHPKWRYLPATMIHEFGHTLGLADLYRFGPRGGQGKGHSGYIMGSMNRKKTNDAVPSTDVEYLTDVYRNHLPH